MLLRTQELYLVNNGQNLLSGQKRILVLGSHVNKGDIELLKKTMFGTVLRKDIEHVYKKMEKSRMHDKKNFVQKFFGESKERKIENVSSDFEKNFKMLVREQGVSCVPMATASTMVKFMPGAEKEKLAVSLKNIGIQNGNDLERLLSKWKNEALNPEYEIERKKKQRTKERTVTIITTR